MSSQKKVTSEIFERHTTTAFAIHGTEATNSSKQNFEGKQLLF
jgi:hypothetical protein